MGLALGLAVTIVAILEPGGIAAADTPSAAVGSALSAGAAGSAVSVGSAQEALSAPANPTVGPLFTNGLSSGHSCTASVLSVGRGLLLTAAHCLSGKPVGIQFIPGYDGTKAQAAPYGIWTVTRSWVPASWVNSEDPQHDYAILQVQDNVVQGQHVAVNDLVGGNGIGIALGKSVAVTVPAYVNGAHDAPISCTAALQVDQGFASFGCAGYFTGTSGAPWIADSTAAAPAVVGIIGGLHQGGCTDSTSYSPDFNADVYLLVIRAVVGLPSDTAPKPDSDGC